ncbi:MAG: orotate phosphoribosyltransferase, partial [Alphaproteobacteria bacterium]
LDQVEMFLNNPLEWSGANGGLSELGITKDS